MIVFEIDGLPELQSAGARGHWRVRHRQKKEWESMVFLAVHSKRPRKPLERVSLRLTRYSTTEPDRDNLATSFKPIIDGLVAASVIQDDKPSIVQKAEFRWEKAKRGKGRIRVEVKDLCAESAGGE